MRRLNQTSGWALNLTGITKALSMVISLRDITEHEAVFVLPKGYAPLLHTKHIDRLSEALTKHFGREMKAVIKIV